MIKVTAEGLRDFKACNLYYRYAHIDKIQGPIHNTVAVKNSFREAFTAVINYFFYKKMAMQEPSYRMLESKWQKKWLKDFSAVDALWNIETHTAARASDSIYTSKAVAGLLAFHEWFKNKPDLEVLLFDEPFEVAIAKDVYLGGTFDVILRNKKPDGQYKYHVYTWAIFQSQKSSDYWSTHFAVVDYAFRHRNNFPPNLDVSYYLWDFTHVKPGIKKYSVEVKDHELLREWVKDLSATEKYVPIRGLSSYCKNCKYDKRCLNWTLEEQQVEISGRR